MKKEELKTAVAAVVALKGKELEAKISELITAQEKATADSEKAQVEIEALTAQIESAKENPGELKRCQKTFKVGGKEYQFKVGFLKFRYAGKVLNAEDVAKDENLREELVEIGFGGIEEIPSK